MKVYKAYTGSFSGEGLVSLVLWRIWIHVLGNMYLYLCILEPHCVYTLFYRKRHYMVLGPNRIATSLDRLIIPRTREVSRVEKSPICISLFLSVVHHVVPWCPTSIVFRVPGMRPRNSVGPSRRGRAVTLCACWCLCVCWEGRGTGLTWPFTWGTRTDLSTAWTVGATSVVSETGG